MDADGTKAGYDLPLTRAVADAVRIPVVASGGAGCPEHLFHVLTAGGAGAALAASIFHYNEYGIRARKAYLAERGGPGRLAPRTDRFRAANVLAVRARNEQRSAKR